MPLYRCHSNMPPMLFATHVVAGPPGTSGRPFCKLQCARKDVRKLVCQRSSHSARSFRFVHDRLYVRSPPLKSLTHATRRAVKVTSSMEAKFSPKSRVNITINSLLMAGIVSGFAYRYADTHTIFWRGWSLSERFHAIPRDIWTLYLSYSATHPLLVPAIITGVTYAIADWISQTYEGRFALDFDRDRILRSAAIGFLVLGPFAHLYYTLQDTAFMHFFPDSPKYTIPMKICFDQTFYAAAYNVMFYSCQGLFRGNSVQTVLNDVRNQFWRLMKAGWKLWPFVHCFTYTIIPTEHKVLWVDGVEIIWASILCIIVNEKRQEAVDAVVALDGTAAKEGVISSVSSYISEVREEQWSEELLPEEEKTVHASTDIAAPKLLEAIDVEELAFTELSELVKQETDQLHSGFYSELDMVTPDSDLNEKIQIADKLEAVLAEVETIEAEAGHKDEGEAPVSMPRESKSTMDTPGPSA